MNFDYLGREGFNAFGILLVVRTDLIGRAGVSGAGVSMPSAFF